MNTETPKAASRCTEQQHVGPDNDLFWSKRVAWVSKYRRRNASTIRAAMHEWERLSGVGMFDPRPNRGICLNSEAYHGGPNPEATSAGAHVRAVARTAQPLVGSLESGKE